MAGLGGPPANGSGGGGPGSGGGGLQGNGSASDDPLGVEQVLVPLLDVLILALGVSGHSLVMVILCGRGRRGRRGAGSPSPPAMGTGTDALLLALSAADLLLLAALPFHAAAVALRRWPFGDFLCRLVGFLGAACSSASAFTLAALAASRYLAVARPALAARLLGARRATALAVALWVPACVLAFPQLVVRSVGPPRSLAPDGVACFAILSPRGQLAYGVSQFLLAFALPLAAIALAYGGVYRFLRRRRREGGGAPQLERYHGRVTQTSAALVLAFALCWLPSYALMFALMTGEGGRGSGAAGSTPRYGGVGAWARFMATCSTVANPVLYVLMSEKFRQDLRALLTRKGEGGGGGAGVQTVA